MTIFALTPYTKITVRSCMRYESAEVFAKTMTQPIPRGLTNRIGNIFWANGILLKHQPFMPSDSLTKEYLKGHLPLDHIDYAPMPRFRNEISIDGMIVTIVDVSNHTLFNDLTKWIKAKWEKGRSSK